ncbi:MotA/TolQ/ExbB proton channel family protein [Fimbriiglobus ruber]|uniref:MotA/TolQ/ExbB proton channel family protein n=1 Tax=Fimbriiglobus ruber TaxID=1908690 RepID=A0A225E429_9BACT|nr:MotA/TolQ/ExbB proton channel family protein [Fimbriiglobus ruber]OWK43157.1 MotA/TolQ/ExbB proton channel family protein [Fimbriiglobus ruber]
MNVTHRRFALSGRIVPLILALVCVFVLVAPALAQEPEAAAPAGGGGGGGNIFFHIIKSVGIFWIILLPTSIWLIAMIVLLTLDLRMSAAIPAGFVDDFTDTVNKRKFKEAYDMVREDPSYLGRVLTAGMARLQYGLEDAREAALNALEGIKSDKEQKNNYTAVIATLGPLLGLVGTVFGMIESFMVLAEAGSSVNASKLAEGISHALAVTLVGVAIAVPAIAFNTFFRNRITQVMLNVGHVSDDLMTQMYHNSKKPGGPVPGPTPGPGPGAPAAVAAVPAAQAAAVPATAPRGH